MDPTAMMNHQNMLQQQLLQWQQSQNIQQRLQQQLLHQQQNTNPLGNGLSIYYVC